MCFLTLEECSDSELHCIYHDPERTVTLVNSRTACSLQVYAPKEDTHAAFGTFHTRRPNDTYAWWRQQHDIAGKQPREATAQPQISRDVLLWHLTRVRPLIPAHDVLDDEELLQTIQPLPSPWTWPRNTFYHEARRGYAAALTESSIAELVTQGLLLANDVGIRWMHLDQYVLVKAEDEVFDRANRPRFEKLDPSAFRRERIARPGMDSELCGVEERAATPIVDLGSPLESPGEKKVRLCSKKVCVSGGGEETVIEEEDVIDNEGRTVGKAREAAGRKVTSGIRWASERGF